MTSVARPHFLLFSEANSDHSGVSDSGCWRFRLEALDGSSRLEASDQEPRQAGERLALLAVVRGLEALEQPSRVTLVTSSAYVARGLRHGLDQWRNNDWRWERYGRMTPVKNMDLWQRVDQALRFHQIECRTWRFDRAHDDLGPQLAAKPLKATRLPTRLRLLKRLRQWAASGGLRGWWGSISIPRQLLQVAR